MKKKKESSTSFLKYEEKNVIYILGFLGDGIPEIVEESRICIGTDCNNRISILEELRSLTYSQHVSQYVFKLIFMSSISLLFTFYTLFLN